MKGVFKYPKEDYERRFGSVKRSSLGMPPCTPKKYPRRLKRLSLGMPPCIPFSISSSFSMLYFYHFICYVLNLERPALYIFIGLVLLAIHNKLDPSFHCLGEEHAPLHLRTQHRLACLSFFLCVFILFS